jgi:TonB-linked SusC/RagA family outer membrane protein
MLLCLPVLLHAQIRITGRVIDNSTNEPLAFVNIVVEGTSSGTATDADGKFAISVPGRESVLQVFYIGYITRHVTVGNSTSLDIRLSEDTQLLDEVIVVGYGVQNKREVTGSIAKVGSEELTAIPASSFENALQGRASGVQISQSNGLAGAGSTIRVRGSGAITAGGEPLIVIDGIPIDQNTGNRIGAINDNPLASLGVSDIESLEILKDASATAIYGSRGANGVVLITTKRGSKGRVQISFNTRVTLSTPSVWFDQVGTEDYIMLYKEAVEMDNKYGGGLTYTTLPGGYSEADALRNNTDWQKEVTQTGVSSQNDLSVGWGNEKLRGYMGIAYTDESSFVVADNFKRTNARLNLDYNLFKWLGAGVNLSFSHINQTYPSVSWDGGYGRALSTALPYYPIYNDDGSFYKAPTTNNPVAEMYNKTRKSFRDRTMANLYLNATIARDLSLRLEANVDYSDNALYYLYTSVLTANPQSQLGNSYRTGRNAKALLNYGLRLSGKHSLKFLAGVEMLASASASNQHNVRFTAGEEDWLFNNPVLPPEYNADGSRNSNNTYTKNPVSEYSFISFFGRINYAYSDRYMLTATFRRDGSSRFGANNKFGNFPALSVGWLLTEEGFLKGNNTISLLKLKAGYGLTGNAEIPNYAQWGTVDTRSSLLYNGQNYWIINALANPNLRWETTGTFDIGLEYGLLKNRISGEIAFYSKRSKDLFLPVSAASSTGYTGILTNVGEVSNTGFEFMIKSRNVVARHFSWTTDFNISYNKNEVLSLGNQSGPDAIGGEGDTRVLVGHPVGSNYLVKFLRVDPADGAPVFEKLDANKQPAGETKTYSTDDRQAVGHPFPDLIGGLNNSFTWKAFDMSLLFSFQLGGSVYDDAEKFQMNNTGSWRPLSKKLERWQQPGDLTDIARMTLGSSKGDNFINPSRNTTEYLHDASFLRLKNLSLGYNLPLYRNKMKLRIYAQAVNLFILKNYFGEPEIIRDMASSQARNVSINVTYLTPPQARTYTIGLNLTF